jgi:mannose-6-phosphate isomerase-like protein (cupin superfamily)
LTPHGVVFCAEYDTLPSGVTLQVRKMSAMSYPDPVYLGERGEASATLRTAGAAPDLVYGNGTRAHFLMTGAWSRGLFGLYRWEMGPAVSGPGPHFHRTMTESFYVLAGSIRIYDGQRWIDTSPGDFVHVPEGGIHGFRNESGAPASMLIHFAPAGPREAYFEGTARLSRGEQMSDEELAEFYLAHDNIWVDER